MKVEIFESDEMVAQKAATIIAMEARKAIALRGRFILAVSGGRTPWKMLRALANEEIQWEGMHIIQVDERFAPDGHSDRNLTHIKESLSAVIPLLAGRIYAMPVTDNDIELAAKSYSGIINKIAGTPVIIDLVHLGLGSDGHTASLTPGDPVLGVTDKDVASTGIYQGRHRLTLTYPIINRSRQILWLIAGNEKREMLQRLMDADLSIPAGLISQENAIILADKDATPSPNGK